MFSLQVFRALELRRAFSDDRRLMNDGSPASRLSLMMAEPEDARLTGQTRNFELRLLVLNVTRQRNAIGVPTSWLARTFKVFHEDPTRTNGPAAHSLSSFACGRQLYADSSANNGPEGVKQFIKAELSEMIG